MDTPPKVLIVGAGPVGLCLACELARYGVPFRLIDKRPEPSKTSKALGIHARSLEMLEDMGLVERFIERGLKVGRINFYADGKPLTHVKLSEVDSPFNFTLDLPQSQTEAIFIERLAELGHPVERYVELIKLEQGPDEVSVELHKKGGVIEKSAYPYVIGCDGAHSTVRKALGLPFEGDAYDEHFALADVHIDSSLAPDEMHMFLHQDGFLILFPMRDKRFRVVATIAGEAEPQLDEAFIQQLMDARTRQQSHVSDGVWFSNFRIHHRIVDQYRIDRVFLAGDAAHIHSPAGGQGMNTGMQDAYNLAWKLALKLEGSVDLLESYSPERHTVGRRVVEMTDRMTKMVTMKNPVATRIRNAVMPVIASMGVVQHRIVNSLEEIDINYRESNWVKDHLDALADDNSRAPFQNGPHAGDRAPDATVTHAANGNPARLFELFQGPRYTFLVLTQADEIAHELSSMQHTLAQCQAMIGKRVHCIYISDRQVPDELDEVPEVYLDARLSAHKAYGVSKQSALYLIRPDGYIAFRSMPIDGVALIAYLQRMGFKDQEFRNPDL